MLPKRMHFSDPYSLNASHAWHARGLQFYTMSELYRPRHMGMTHEWKRFLFKENKNKWRN